MRPGRPSWTAEGIASIRAAERILKPPDRRVFDDPLAWHFLRGRFRLMTRWRPLAWASDRIQQRLYRGLAHEALARARYAEQTLERMVAGGARQVVILAAGYDGTAWKESFPADLRVFEVDHPATQSLKRARLAEAGLTVPNRLTFVPAHLDREELLPALRAAGFDAAHPALVTALGLLVYLKPEEVETLLAQVGSGFAPGSEVIYDFMSRYLLDARDGPPGVRRAARLLARRGEPLVFAADPSEMESLARRAGLRTVETLTGEEMTARYFAPLGDRRTIERGVNLARAVIDPRASR